MSNQITINKSTVKIVGIVITAILVCTLIGFLGKKGYEKYSVSQCKTGKVVGFGDGATLYTLKEMQDNPKYLKCVEMLPEEVVGMAFFNIKEPNTDEGKLAFFKAVEGIKKFKDSFSTGIEEEFAKGFNEGLENAKSVNFEPNEEQLNADVDAMTKQMQEDAEKIVYDATDYSKPVKSNYKFATTEGSIVEATNCSNPSRQSTDYANGLTLESVVENCDDGAFVFTGTEPNGVVHLKLVTVNGDTYYRNNKV